MCYQNSEDAPPEDYCSDASPDAKLPLPSIALFRQAVAQHSMAETRFGIVDVQTANLVVQCYGLGNEYTKKVFDDALQHSSARADAIYKRCWSLVGA